MAGFTIDYDFKIIDCDCGHRINLADSHVFYFCQDCVQYHLHCCGCGLNIKLPWIIQDYIRTYQETLKRKTERMN